MTFFLETLLGGLLAGTMYSLVAIGFVLIYKASGVFNFAQGAMVLFAALTFVTLHEQGLPVVLALVLLTFSGAPFVALMLGLTGLLICHHSRFDGARRVAADDTQTAAIH